MNASHKTIITCDPEVYPRIFSKDFIERLSQSTSLLSAYENFKKIHEKKDLIAEVEIVIGSWGMPLFDEDLLAQMPNLKGVFYAAGSVKYFLTPAFWKRNIILSSAAQANAIPVAEMAFSQIILSLKNYWYYTLSLTGKSKFSQPIQCFGTYKSKVGLISLGAIGKRVLERLKTLDVQTLVYDPYLSPEKAGELGVTLVSLEELFSQSDVISVHAPWIPQTEKMIRKKHFLSMKKGASFINTARGAVVDEPEMIEVLQERPDLWAILDVTYPEPPLKDSLLYTLSNVVLSPHIAGSISNECHRMADWMLEEIERFQSNKPLNHQVHEKDIERMA